MSTATAHTLSNDTDRQYHALLERLLEAKKTTLVRDDRTGVGRVGVFGHEMKFDITGGRIPAITTKEVKLWMVARELRWMLSGDTNIRYLKEHDVGIWDSWIDLATAKYVHIPDYELGVEIQKKNVFPEMINHLARSSPMTDPSELTRAFAEKHGIKTTRLVAGNLPHVYGAQWRAWNDVRIIDQREWHPSLCPGVLSGLDGDLGMEEEGFQQVFSYDHPDAEGNRKMVVRREIDQIERIMYQLINQPMSSRIILSGWNVAYIDEMALAPCHCLAQFYVRELSEKDQRGLSTPELPNPKYALSCKLTQRSADSVLGVPFNIVQYALLTHILAKAAGMVTEEFIWSGGDVHYYTNQEKGLREQFIRQSKTEKPTRVKIHSELTGMNIIDAIKSDEEVVIEFTGYESHPFIKFPKAAV